MRDSAFYALVFSLSWAVGLTFSKAALSAGADAFAFAVQVTFIAALLLSAYGLAFKKIRLADGRIFRRIVLIAAIYILSLFTGYYGLDNSTLINYGFLIKTTVVFTVFLSAAFLKERLSARKIFLVAVLLSGAYLLSTKGMLMLPMAGDLFIVLTAFLLSAGNVIAKRVVGSVDPFDFALIRTLASSAILLPVAFTLNPSPFHVVSKTFKTSFENFYFFVYAQLFYCHKK